MRARPVGAPELVDRLQTVVAAMILEYGETPMILEMLGTIAALRLAVGAPARPVLHEDGYPIEEMGT